MKTKKLVFLGVMASLALVLAFLESLLPPVAAALPGVKMGLPNIVILFILYRYGIREAAAVSLVRLLLAALLFGSALTLAYSAAGAALSLAVMAVLRHTGAFSTVGVSLSGGVAHNVGQILVAVFLLGTAELAYYLPVLVISGTVGGVLVGLCGAFLLGRLGQHEV